MIIPGSLIRHRRMQLGLTQQALGNIAGISWADVSRLENDRVSHPDQAVIDSLAHTLRMSLQSEELLTAYEKIPVRQRRRMMKVLEQEYPLSFGIVVSRTSA